MDTITQILENVVRCKYLEAGVHIKNPIKNSYQDGLGRTTQTLEHVIMVHILIWDKRKSQPNEYSDQDGSSFMVAISTSLRMPQPLLGRLHPQWETYSHLRLGTSNLAMPPSAVHLGDQQHFHP